MGNVNSNENPHARFLVGSPEIPPAPAEREVQIDFDELLRAKHVGPELCGELNAMESHEAKWTYVFLYKLPRGAVEDEWLDPGNCVQLVKNLHGDMNCVHDLFQAIRINILLRPSKWTEKFLALNGVGSLVELLKMSEGTTSAVCDEVLRVLFVLTNHPVGVPSMLKATSCCTQLRAIFDSTSTNVVKTRALKLLGMLCKHSLVAQEAVMNAFTTGSLPSDHPFRSMITQLEQTPADIAFQTAVVEFLNVLVDTTSEPDRRAALCKNLMSHGLRTLVERCRAKLNTTGESDSDGMGQFVAQADIFLSFSDNGVSAEKVATGADNSMAETSIHIAEALSSHSAERDPAIENEDTGNQQDENGAGSDQVLEDGRGEQGANDLEDDIPCDEGASNLTADGIAARDPHGNQDTTSVGKGTNPQGETISEKLPTVATSPLDQAFDQLQLQMQKLDHETSEKFTRLLESLALTLSDDKSAGPEVVDRLSKSFLRDVSSVGDNDAKATSGEPHDASPPSNSTVTAAPAQESPDFLTRVSLALFANSDESAECAAPKSATAVTKPPSSGRSGLFSGFADFSLASLTTPTPSKNSISKSSHSGFAGTGIPSSPWGRRIDSIPSSGAASLKLSLPFFQSSRKGPGLGMTPACTPIATASVRKDAKRPVFPSMPSPPGKKEEDASAPPPPSLPPIHIAATAPVLEAVAELVLEEECNSNTTDVMVPPATTGTDVSKFRKLLSMGASREAVRAKMKQAGVNPDLLNEQQGFPSVTPSTNAVERPTLTISNLTDVQTGPDISKFRKQPSMDAPLEALKGKMHEPSLDPQHPNKKMQFPNVTELSGLSALRSTKEANRNAAAGPDLSKFKKLLEMGAPLPAVKAKMIQAGLDPDLVDGPEPVGFTSPVRPIKKLVKDDPAYAKFFKLQSMGAPAVAVKAKMRQAGLDANLLDTPDATMPTKSSPSKFDANPASAGETARVTLTKIFENRLTSPEPPVAMKVKENLQYARFFKLLSMGAPADSVKAKMKMAGLQPELLDSPDAPMPSALDGENVVDHQARKKVKEDSQYAKFFKLLSMGAPAESVKAKMRMAGLQPELLDTPEASMPSLSAPEQDITAPVKVKDDPSYSKFFKLLSMGAPVESVKAKMKMAGLKPELLDTPDADMQTGGIHMQSQPQVKVKDDPAYAKFFKLLSMGAPPENVKTKMRMAGLQSDLLDTPDAFVPTPSSTATAVAPNGTVSRRGKLSIAIKPVVKAKTRSFYWQHLKSDAIKGTIWEELEKEQSNLNNQSLLTLTETDLVVLESEFPPPQAHGPSTGGRRGSLLGSPAAGPASPVGSPRVVFLIDRARSNNISIIVKQFRMSNAALRAAIMKMDSEVITLERVQGLIKILPTEEEIASITGFQGDPTTLNGAERILKELISVPRLKQRLAALEAKIQFPGFVRDLQAKVIKLRMATTEITQSAEFKLILLVVLQVGNKMNDGTNRGNAKGFRLADLTKLVQLKSVDKSVTLLHYVARIVRLKKGNVVRLGDSLASLYDVQSIAIPELQGDMSRISDITESVNTELAAQRLKNRIEAKEENDAFVEVMTEFVEEAEKNVVTVKKELDETMQFLKETMLRYDREPEEDGNVAPAESVPSTTTMAGASEFFSVIYEFSMALMKADRENELKRIRDEKRLKQQQCMTPGRVRSKSSVELLGVRSVGKPQNASGDKGVSPETPEEPRSKVCTRTGENESLQSVRKGPLSPKSSNNAMSVGSRNPAASAEEPARITDEPTGSATEKSKLKKPQPMSITKPPQHSRGDLVAGQKKRVEFQSPENPKVVNSAVNAKLKATPKTAMKVPGKIVRSLSMSSPVPSLKNTKGVALKPSTSPRKILSASSVEKPKSKTHPESTVPFDTSSISEIHSQLKTRHTSSKTSSQQGSLKPELEADGDDHGNNNNNNESVSPEKVASPVQPSTDMALEIDA